MTRTSTLNHSQLKRPVRLALGIVTNLARAADVVHATTADFRVRRVYTNVFTVMPATTALRMAGLDHLELEARHFGHYGVGRRVSQRRDAGRRGDQHETQFVAQLRQVRYQSVFGIQRHFGLQVAADGLGCPQVFHFLVDRDLDRHDPLPVGAVQFKVSRHFAQAFVPGIEHHRFVTLTRQVLPQLVGGEGQDRSDPAHQRFGDVEQCRLAGATRGAVSGRGVLTVLDDVQIKPTQLLHAEVVDLGVHVPETVFAVMLLQLALQQQGTVHGPTIQRQHFFGRQDVGGRVETGQVRQQEARGVTDTPVGVRTALQDLVGNRHFAGVVGRSHPQTHDVGAQGVVDLLRRNHVAQGFGHLAAALVHGETVGQQLAVRRVVVNGATGQQRGVEPSTVLVRTFQVQVGTRAALMTHRVRAAQHVPVRGPGVEPDVQRVSDLVVFRGFVTQQLGRVHLEPGFDALLFDALGNFFHQLDGAWMQLAAFLVQEERDRYAPVTLTGDAPVRAVGDHRVQACLAPGRNGFCFFDGLDGALTQGIACGRLLVHAYEPLRRGAVDQRRLVAPAVHVAVNDGFGVHQAANFAQLLDHVRVGLPDELAAEELQRLGVYAVALHRGQDVIVDHAVTLAGHEVVFTIGRCRVNHTGARTQLDVISQVHRRQTIVERVTEVDQVQRRAFCCRDDRALQLVARQTGFDQLFGQYQQLVAHIDQCVLELWMDVQGLVGREGPRRGGPDDDRRRLAQRWQAESGSEFRVVNHSEGDVDGRRFLVGVFDFRFSQGRTTIEAPVDRFQALEDEAALDHFSQRTDFPGFVGEVHGQVRVVPIAQHTQADELGFLAFNLLGGVGTAQLTGTVRSQVLAVGHFNLVLDRQAVAVPARDIRRVETRKGFRANDHVLENLVQRMTDVNSAVGIRRAVVQDELRTILANLAQLLVQANAVPALQNLRLALGQAGLHWEGGVRKV